MHERHALNEWFSRTPGRFILEAELTELNHRLPDLFGYYLLQIGDLGGVDVLEKSRVLHRSIIDIDGRCRRMPYPCVRGAPDALPIVSDSVDVVLLLHILEFEERPHEALREAQRVLVPEGHLLISGFNPWSLMGFWRKLRASEAAPWGGQFLRLNRIKDWLVLLGFDVIGVDTYFFLPPFRNERLMRRLRRLETGRVGALRPFAGAYLVTAKKRVSMATPIKPRWSHRRRLVGAGLAEPTARVVSLARARRTREAARAGGGDGAPVPARWR